MVDSAFGLDSDILVDILILYFFCYFDGLAGCHFASFPPPDDEAAGEADVDVYFLDVYSELVVKNLGHRFVF